MSGPDPTIETEPFPPRVAGWVIDGAPNCDPYWPLLDEIGTRVARLYLLFKDHAQAEESLQAEFHDRHPELRQHVQRAVYKLSVSDAAVLRVVKSASDELRQWTIDVVERGRAMPMPGILDQRADVAFLPSELGVFPGNLAIVDERAFSAGRVRCLPSSRPRGWS